jgi:hypothetical protein
VECLPSTTPSVLLKGNLILSKQEKSRRASFVVWLLPSHLVY